MEKLREFMIILRVNIIMEKNGMEKYIIKKEKKNMKLNMEMGK